MNWQIVPLLIAILNSPRAFCCSQSAELLFKSSLLFANKFLVNFELLNLIIKYFLFIANNFVSLMHFP